MIVWLPQLLAFGVAHSSFRTFTDSGSQMIMKFDPTGGRDCDGREFSDVIGEVVQEYLGDTPAVEIIGVLETAKACAIKAAIKELQGGEE